MQNPHKTKCSPNNLEFNVLDDSKLTALLSHLLDLTMRLHLLDQGDQPSDHVERQLEHVYLQILPKVRVDTPHTVVREGRVYQVWVNADGVTFQAALTMPDSLEATA